MWVIVLQRKISESLTARIFLITSLILLGAGVVTFGLIAWATPGIYTSVVTEDLQKQTDALAAVSYTHLDVYKRQITDRV